MITLLWIEKATDGTAAHSHLDGTISRLNQTTNQYRVIANTEEGGDREGVKERFNRISVLLFKGFITAKKKDVLIARFHPLLLPVICWWRIIGGKSILLVQGSLDDVSAPGNSILARFKVTRWLSVLTMRTADKIIVGAPTIKSHIESFVPRKVVGSIPNGVFTDRLAKAKNHSSPMNGPYAVYVGNFATWQGIEYMVEAVNSADWPSDLPLVVIGDGVERELIESKQSDRLIWLGRLPSEQALIWLANATCSISLKRSDTATGKHGYWPFKLIESAAVGTPMVTSDAPGMPDAAQALGHALVIRAQDAKAAAKAVARIHRDRELREQLGSNGIKRVAKYDWLAGATALEMYITELHGK